MQKQSQTNSGQSKETPPDKRLQIPIEMKGSPDRRDGYDPEEGANARRSRRAPSKEEIEQNVGAEIGEILEVIAPGQAQDPKAGKKRRRVYVAVSYLFVLIFVSLIGYIVYFNIELRDDYLRSPYNKRQDVLTNYVKRGNIISSDGTVLAYSETDEAGEACRVYPYGRMYAHVIGYDTHGRSGVENIANTDLLTSHDSIPEQAWHELKGEKNTGDDVVTTIDSRLQSAAYESLGENQGAIVVLDPSTGAMKALVSKPDFDPNDIAGSWAEIIGEAGSSVLVNRATQGRYAPGSTFKIITTLAYKRTYGSIDDFYYNCEGELTVDGHTIHCYESSAHGEEDLTEAFAKSCNCAYAQIGLSFRGNELASAAETLLFNKELPSAGLLYNSSSFSYESGDGIMQTMQTAFGQGSTLTSPYHMALIASCVANDGILMEPYLVEKVITPDKTVISKTEPQAYKKLLSEDDAKLLQDLMENVVSSGTASSLSGASYEAAGKTGSAEYVKSDGSIGTHSWFVGYAEEDGRKLAIAVLVENGGSGSGTAVPIAKNVLNAYYNS